LISIKDEYLLLMEVKKVNSSESLLKAILEIFVYVYRLYKFKTINKFKEEYDSFYKVVVPVVLTFNNSTSGLQILEFNNYPYLKKLLKRINMELNLYRIREIQFFTVDSYSDKWDTALKLKDEKIYLNRHISIAQYFIQTDCNEFESIIISTSNTQDIESCLNSYFTYCNDDAIRFVNKHIPYLLEEIAKFNAIYPKNKLLNDNHSDWAWKKAYPFFEAYRNIAKKHNCYELLDLNLQLMKPNDNSLMVPIVSCFKEEKVFLKLIEAYHEIPIKRSHDYDGVTGNEIDLGQEAIIISAISQYNDARVIPILLASLLQGKYSKETVVTTLLKHKSKDEIINYVKPYAESKNFLLGALTDNCENAQWVIKYLTNI
jgi:hypothetical protein